MASEFKGTNLVTIKNALDNDFGYVYTDPEEEEVQQPDTATKRVYFGDPKARVLKPGEKVTIQGWEAYIALGKMWKEYAQTTSNVGVTMSSVAEMRNFLGKAYLGVFDPNSIGSAKAEAKPSKEELAAAADKSEDLGFSE